MRSPAREVVVKQCKVNEEMSQVCRLALATGMEEDEIGQMSRIDNIFIARKNETTIGFIALRGRRRQKSIEITSLAIKKDERRKGLGGSLLERAEEFARRLSMQKLTARTTNDNIPALKLYRKHGYAVRQVKTGAMIRHHKGREILGWNGIPVRDEIVLEKKL